MARPNITSKEDWLKAGFQILVESGPVGLRVEALARKIGVSKGGFYGTFGALPAFHDAMLGLWRVRAADELIEHLDLIADPQLRLQALLDAAVAPPDQEWGGPMAELAVRAWALESAHVARAVQDVDQLRIAWLKRLFHDLSAVPELAELFYCGYLGAMTLEPEGQEIVRAKLALLSEKLLTK